MDIDDQGLDINFLTEDGVVTQNGDPVDADFDVICTDDICFSADDDHNGTCDDLPIGLLSALKKDAAEAAQAAASKKKPEGNFTAMDSVSVSSTATPPFSAAHLTVSAAEQTVPTVQQTVPAAEQTVPTVHKAVPAAEQAVPTVHQTVPTVLKAVPAAEPAVPTVHKAVPAAEQTVPAANKAVSVSPALNTAVFSADPALYTSTSTYADATATVPKTAAASTAATTIAAAPTAAAPTAAFNPVLSCLPTQMPDLVPHITGGANIKELVIGHSSLPLEDEWSCVETELIVPGEGKPSHIYTAQEAAVVKAEPVISFEEVLEYFKSADMSEIKPKIHQTIERRGFSAWTYYFFGPPKLRNNLLASKELTFCMAATTFDNCNTIHVRSLLALYRNLTGAPNDCRRFGNHWETIGFQGNDPSTDLRGVGLFGLLQLLYLTSKPQFETLKKQIYILSNHNTQNFPFCVMGLNLSKLVLQTLREDKLNRLCNRREDLVSVINDAFVATYYKVYHIWKSQNKTIVDSGFVLKEVENQLRKSPQNLIKELEEYVKNPNTAAAAPKRKSSKSSDKLDDFVGIADILVK